MKVRTNGLTANRSHLVVLLVLGLGFYLRGYEYARVPPSLHVDEAAAGYNALSLLQTGADFWGTYLPVYFLNWGVGQNVLYSYLSVPIVALIGLSSFSIRLVNLILGILTLPLLYITVKRILGRDIAIISTLLLAIMPFHVMYSRWGLDSTPFPFFILLGVYLISHALNPGANPWQISALIPFGIGLYAYAIGYALLPFLLVMVFLVYRKIIMGDWKNWLVSLFLFCLCFLPILLFVIKNFVMYASLPIEPYLPFGLPLLLSSRLDYARRGELSDLLLNNIAFIATGFQDGESQHSVHGMPPTFMVLFPLVLVGAVFTIRRYRSTGVVDLFSLWLAACLPLFVTVNLTITRINAIFIPMLVVGTQGLLALFAALGKNLRSRRILALGVSTLAAVQVTIFVPTYFFVYPFQPETEWVFPRGFERALRTGLAIAGQSENILVTTKVPGPNMMVPFYASYPVEKYRREVRYLIDSGIVATQSFGRFYFDAENLPDTSEPFTFVLTKWDEDPCEAPRVFLETRLWKVGTCNH